MLGDGPLKWSRTLVAQHHARWLSAIILILKMCIVGLRFLTQPEFKNILDLGFFFTHPFPAFWFSCPILTYAPQLTLDLHRDIKWGTRDPTLSKAVAQKLQNHTWYLTRANVIFALFSHRVSADAKTAMAAALAPHLENWEDESTRPLILPGKPQLPMIKPGATLADFIGEESFLLFNVGGYICPCSSY